MDDLSYYGNLIQIYAPHYRSLRYQSRFYYTHMRAVYLFLTTPSITLEQLEYEIPDNIELSGRFLFTLFQNTRLENLIYLESVTDKFTDSLPAFFPQ